jgi:AraC-like DNA-binding protein
MNNKKATTISTITEAILQALKYYACDPTPLFDKAGIQLDRNNDPFSRHPVTTMTLLWQSCVEETGDEAFGLQVARCVHPTMFQALSLSAMFSDNVEQALERLCRFSRMVSDVAEVRLEKSEDISRLVFSCFDDQAAPSPEALDTFMASAYLLLKGVTQERVTLQSVTLKRRKPLQTKAWEDLFEATVEFDSCENILLFKTKELKIRLVSANPQLASLNEQVLIQYLARFDTGCIKSQVIVELTKLLPKGNPNQQTVAQALCMSSRTLQRRLQSLGSSFSETLDTLRRELAAQYMQQSQLSINEISCLLGFSNPSNFNRAFKRWYHKSPGLYRSTESDHV